MSMRTAIDWSSKTEGKVTTLVGKVLNRDTKAIEEEIKNAPIDTPNLTSKLLDSFIEIKNADDKIKDLIYESFEKYHPEYKADKDVSYKWKYDCYVDPDFVI